MFPENTRPSAVTVPTSDSVTADADRLDASEKRHIAASPDPTHECTVAEMAPGSAAADAAPAAAPHAAPSQPD